MDFGNVSGKTFRFLVGHHRSRSGSGGYRNGFQFQRRVCHGKIQRLLLLPQASGSLVSFGNRGSVRHQKPGLPQIAPAHLPHHGDDFSAFACSHVSRSQQGSRRSAKVADPGRAFISTFRTGEICPRAFYRQVSGQTGRQIKGLRIRLSPKSNCPRFLFHPNSVSARFWHRNDHMHGHLHNAFYRWPEKKVPLFFRAGANSFHSLGDHECGIPHPKNHRFSRPLARPFGCRVSSHSIFLCFWSRGLLGSRLRSQPSKTLLPSRSSHGFHFFRHWGRTRVYGNHSHHSFIFNFNLAGFRHRLSGQRSIWNSFGNRSDSFDRISSFYKSGSSRRASSNQGINSSLHQHGRIIHVNHHAFSGRSSEYFRTND
jgi:hypothetical protein